MDSESNTSSFSSHNSDMNMGISYWTRTKIKPALSYYPQHWRPHFGSDWKHMRCYRWDKYVQYVCYAYRFHYTLWVFGLGCVAVEYMCSDGAMKLFVGHLNAMLEVWMSGIQCELCCTEWNCILCILYSCVLIENVSGLCIMVSSHDIWRWMYVSTSCVKVLVYVCWFKEKSVKLVLHLFLFVIWLVVFYNPFFRSYGCSTHCTHTTVIPLNFAHYKRHAVNFHCQKQFKYNLL